jgi:hypothetical protein
MASDVRRSVGQVLISSVIVTPDDPGLTRDEVVQVCESTAVRLYRGEVEAMLDQEDGSPFLYIERAGRLLPAQSTIVQEWAISGGGRLHNLAALDWIVAELQLLARQHPGQWSDASGLINRGIAARHAERDLRVCVALMSLSRMFFEANQNGSAVRLVPIARRDVKPSEEARRSAPRPHQWDPTGMLAAVAAVVRRRGPGIASHEDALEVFGRQLEALRWPQYKACWDLTTAELKRDLPGFFGPRITGEDPLLTDSSIAAASS